MDTRRRWLPADDVMGKLPPCTREPDGRERLELATVESTLGTATLIVRTHPGNGSMLLSIEAQEIPVMQLVDLQPRLLAYPDDPGNRTRRYVERLDDAQGLLLLCPGCFHRNGGAIGTHAIEVTFAGRGVTDALGSHGEGGRASRWTVTGTGLQDLSLQPSILLSGDGCGWHGFVTNGQVTTC